MCARLRKGLRVGGETMNKTPTREIMDDEIVYKNRRELPPDAGA
jgi:hypothetical protein